MIFTYKQNKHLAATDFGRIWVGNITWGQAGPQYGKRDVLPATTGLSLSCDCMSVTCCHRAAVCGHFFSSTHVQRNAVIILSTACKKKHKSLLYGVLVKKFREVREFHWNSDSTSSLDTEYCLQSRDPTWSPLTVSEYMFIGPRPCVDNTQCPGLLLLFLKNTKHKDILNIITHCNKQ